MENTMMNNVEEVMEEIVPTMPAINQDMIISEEPKKVAKIKSNKLLKIAAGVCVVYAVHKTVGKKVRKHIREAIKGIVREVMAENAAVGYSPDEATCVMETSNETED